MANASCSRISENPRDFGDEVDYVLPSLRDPLPQGHLDHGFAYGQMQECTGAFVGSDDHRPTEEHVQRQPDNDVTADQKLAAAAEPTSSKKRKRVAAAATSTTRKTAEPSDGPPTKSPPRPRVRNLKRSEQNKLRRNEGLEYVGKNGVVVAARRMGEMCRCPLRCAERVSESERQLLFTRFWDTGNFDQQNAYLFGRMQAVPIKRRYGKQPGKSVMRHCSFLFRVRCGEEERRVCKAAFMAIHGLQRNRGRLNNVMKRIKDAADQPASDGRGRHDNRPNRTSAETLASIHRHIEAVPKYVSRLSLREHPGRVYLNCELNTTLLYGQHYVPFCEAEGLTPASEDKYRRVFGAAGDVGFRLPRIDDTCRACEFLQPSLEQGTPDQRTQARLLSQLHLWKVEAPLALLKELSARAREQPHAVHVVAVDLGPLLPTPKLTCPDAFYRRRLWTYSVVIRDCGAEVSLAFVWDESTAPRGSEEIASCLLKYVVTRPVRSQRLVVFTNGCAEQTKNWRAMGLWRHLVASGHVREVEHYFLAQGHSPLPTDRDLAAVDKYHRVCEPQVYTPYHWAEVVGRTSKKRKIFVTHMGAYDFFDLSDVEPASDGHRLLRYGDGTEVDLSEVVCCRFEGASPDAAFVRHFVHEEFRRVALAVRPFSNNQQQQPRHHAVLRNKYETSRKLPQIKLNDLMALLDFIPNDYQEFYTRLTGDGSAVDASEPENIDDAFN